ncbi:hypothetical protein [Peloplasma aerotolerans]|uniref:Uncharacterized protein n=1 Tax=Peloplasma aerotolerans TaxID=3044389 RepID=A0AAW6UAF8_9MOLU|nr:hypothetical protein [Mariniplasma sp. M4Ah]MDI6451948.1 hypothetical protein [Mariniplasma sp. M4Ah]
MKEIIACICEGSAETAIIEILLDHEFLIFNRDQLLDNEILSQTYRNPKNFRRDYLIRQFEEDDELKVYLIVDRVTSFKIKEQISIKMTVEQIITKPEIEILYIISVEKYNEYTTKYSSKMTPNEYIKRILKIKDIKKYDFVKMHSSDIDFLIKTIIKYHSYKKSKNKDLLTLIRAEKIKGVR